MCPGVRTLCYRNGAEMAPPEDGTVSRMSVNAAGLLSAFYEASDGNGHELLEAKNALYSVLQKAGKAQGRTSKKDLINRALRVADEILAEG